VGDSFTHLHLHTEFSMLDGAARVRDVITAAKADGQPAIGITDHGNMYGVLDFYKEARDAGVKPIIGSELYMAGQSRHDRPARRGRIDDGGGEGDQGDKLYYHLTVLAENNQGYKNLLKLSSEAYLEGYWYKPRADWEILERHHEGVIATTGCLGGVVLQALLRGDFEAACGHAARLQDIFGRDNLFVELQDHGLDKQRKTNPQLLDIARRIGAPVLATNDSHYTSREDAVAHDALLCVQTGSMMDDTNRFKFEGDEHYLKSASEMRHLFSEIPEACDNTLWIAERADVEIEFGKPKLPSFPRPPEFADADCYLRDLAQRGAESRYGTPIPDRVRERLDYELGVISSMGFSDYFLVVGDLIRHAREKGIRVGPGRGSAAGCCVAYCLQIVDLDPIRYDLLFERFLNPGRKQMPDIDMDFDERYRSEMIRYAAERYGWDHVAQIVTFSTIKARAAVRDAARVLGYPYGVGDRIAKAMPPLVMGRDTPLWACFEQHPKYEDGFKTAAELREMYAVDPDAKKVIDVAKGLEGLRRQDGIHAAAVVISADPLTEYLPIQRKPEAGKPVEEAPIVTQYEMHGVEELGLLKMDFLGLRNLSVIERTLDLIEANTGERPDIDNVPLNDEKTFDLLRKGDSIGVFQLEGSNMRSLMRALAPTSFDDVAALVALYRPGPMAANMHYDYADRKNGRKPVVYEHPDMAEALSDTYGLCLTGDTVVHDVRTGRPIRLDQVDPSSGIMVQAVDDERRPVAKPVTHWVCNGQRETVRVTLSNGISLAGTPDHLVLTDAGWSPLGELTADSHVALARHLMGPEQPEYVDPDQRPGCEQAGLPRWHLSPYATAQHPRVHEGTVVAFADTFNARDLDRWLRLNWVRVDRVEPSGRQLVYDITVDEVHNFVANGIIAHNCIYQEQMMRLAQVFAGYSLEEADNLRKAAGKKVREIMAKEREKFVAGCEQTGYGHEIGTQLFDLIEPFADYAFNKSHSYGYGFVSYQTAWLKANHPVEYLAALLTSVKDDKDKTAVYLAECRNLGIEVLVPDVNVSSSDFSAVRGDGSAGKGAIPFGMSAVRNVGSGLVERIVIDREANGPFKDFYDFCERVDPIVLNKRTVESLIKAGAFDSVGHPRQGLCLVFEQIVDRILARRREREQGVMSLFGDLGGAESGPAVFDDARLPIPDNEFEKMQRLAFEKEMLGLYVSDHPLMGAEAALRRHAEVTVRQMREQNEGELKWVGGVITGLVRKYTKRGDLMATFALEDLEAALDVWVFPRTMQEVGHLLADDEVVCVRGRLDLRDDEAKLICMELRRPELVLDGAEPLHLALPLHVLSDDRVDQLKRLLVDHPGESPVFLHVGSKTIRLADGFNVEARNGLLAELRVLLGPSCFWQGALE
jgi:DNA polymerase III alpha subunit